MKCMGQTEQGSYAPIGHKCPLRSYDPCFLFFSTPDVLLPAKAGARPPALPADSYCFPTIGTLDC